MTTKDGKPYIKRISVPKYRKHIYDYLEELSSKGNMSEYLCDLIERDIKRGAGTQQNNDDEVLKQLKELNIKIDTLIEMKDVKEQEINMEIKKDVKSLGFDLD